MSARELQDGLLIAYLPKNWQRSMFAGMTANTESVSKSDDDFDEQVSNRVKVLLVRRGEQRQELAENLGISPSSLSRSLTDDPSRRREWAARDIKRLSIHFNVDPDLFFTDEKSFWQRMSEL